MGVAAWWPELDAELEAALARISAEDRSVVVLFSGGVDSGLLAWECGRRGQPTLFTVGVDPAPDLRAAAEGAGALGLPWSGRRFEEAELERIVREVSDELAAVGPPRRGIFLALAAAAATAPPGVLLCGQGADELFLGYAHYRPLTRERASERAMSDLRALVDTDWPRTVRLAQRFHREIRAPYLAPGFLRVAGRIPIDERLPGEQPKAAFRRWARHRGLPALLADRPKRALQYGSGFDRWLRRRARATGPGSPPRPGAPAATKGCP